MYNKYEVLNKSLDYLYLNEFKEARTILDTYLGLRQNIYITLEKDIHRYLSEVYNPETSELIRQLNDNIDQVLIKIYEKLQTNDKINEDFTNIQLLFNEVRPLISPSEQNSTTITNVTLSVLNIVFYPKQNSEEHGVPKIKEYLKNANDKIDKILDIL